MNNLLTAITFDGMYYRPLLNLMHPNTTGVLDYSSIFSHQSELAGIRSAYQHITFFMDTQDEDSRTWHEVEVQPRWNTYYMMAKSQSSDWFFAPDLEGIPFYYLGELHTLQAVDYGDRKDWELIKLPLEIAPEELPRGNFWAH